MAHQCSHGVAAAVVLLFLHQYGEGLAQTIDVAPKTAVVPLGDSHTFPCVVTGSAAILVINGTLVDHSIEHQRRFADMGFLFAESEEPLSLNVTIPATRETNNTEIKCRTYSHRTITSEAAFIIVIGPPSMPDPLIQVVAPTTLLLSWNIPFTWDDYDILNYTIAFQGTTSARHIIQECTIDATCNETRGDGSCGGTVLLVNATIDVACNETNIALVLDTNGEILTTCTELKFSIAATSLLGISETATITGGFPIAPPPFSTPVNCSVYFKSDGSPAVEIHFRLSNVCTFQYPIKYTITVENLNLTTNNTFMLGPVSVSSADCEEPMEEDITEGLMIDRMYSVTVAMYTVAGSSNATSYFSTDFSPTEGYNSTNTDTTTVTDNDHRDMHADSMLVAATVTASAIALAALCMCIILACLYLRSRRVLGNIKTRKAQTAMIPNPIYEGPLYESISQQFSTLTASVEARESRYLNNPVNPTTREETDGTTMHSQKVEDNYTVMESVSMHMGGNGEEKME